MSLLECPRAGRSYLHPDQGETLGRRDRVVPPRWTRQRVRSDPSPLSSPPREPSSDVAITAQLPRVEISPLVRLWTTEGPPRRFKMLQQWEAIVTALAEDCFVVRLRDLSCPKLPDEVAELPLAEIPESDRELLAPGSIIYWSIGYETSEGGQIRRVSELRLKRRPVWTERMLAEIKKKAATMLERYQADNATGNEHAT